MNRRTLIRVLIPTILLLTWFSLAGFGGPTFGKLSNVTSNDQTAFLPASAESTKVEQLQKKFNESNAIPAIIVVESSNNFNQDQLHVLGQIPSSLQRIAGLQKIAGSPDNLVIGPIPSKDRKAAEFIVPVTDSKNTATVIENIRSVVHDKVPAGIKVYVSGPAGLTADLVKAFNGIDGILLVVAIGVVFIILVIVYRSLLLPFIVLFTALFALCGAILVIYTLASHNVIKLNGQSQGILSILVIGAATDYSLLFVSRFKESLGMDLSKWNAALRALKVATEPIIASAATVILALLCLLFSDLNSNRSLGPIAAIGIAFACMAGLTLLPSILVVFGKVAFWPAKIAVPKSQTPPAITTGLEESRGIWLKAGRLIRGNATSVWISVAVVLGICSLGILQLHASGVPQTKVILGKSEAVDGQAAIARHFSAGSGTPLVVIAPENYTQQTIDTLMHNPNIASVMPYSTRSFETGIGMPKIVDGQVLLNATLRNNPYSAKAESAVKSIRQDLSAINSNILVGGTTATDLDTNTTAKRDLFVIVPIVLAVILIVLMLLLRAIVAPLLLIVTVILSFGATLGISAFVFNYIFHMPGADPSVPLFGFVFLVALGVDYNIFLMSRIREETFRYGTRAATLHSLSKTGGVITSAGIVLASTFAALGVIPILFLAQIAFIVAFGVLLDTIIVRSLLVPALIYATGPISWWPSRKLRS